MKEPINEATGAGRESFIIMAKPAGPACNMNCRYCYYLEVSDLFADSEKFRMPDDVLEAYIAQYITASPATEVLFVWHGGEPTLAGLDFFHRVIELQQKYTPEGRLFRNNLQTNGTLLDDEWCTFLAENHFDVGLSIDGTEWIHDRYRTDRLGKGTYTRCSEAVCRLRDHDILPDLLCTVTSDSAKEPVSVYRSLREFDTGWIQFIPIVNRTPDGGVTPESVTAEAYGQFLCKVFDQWLYNDYDRLNVQLFAEMFLVWAGGTSTVCWMAPTCGRVPVIEHNGNIYSCDHFVNREHCLGNISTTKLADLTDSPEQLRFGENKRTLLPRQCFDCRWLDVCNGLCPKDRFLKSEDGEPGLNYLCRGVQEFYKHAEQPLKRVISLRKRGVSPQSIRAEFHAELVEKWKGKGRNDLCPCGSGKKAKHCCWELRP